MKNMEKIKLFLINNVSFIIKPLKICHLYINAIYQYGSNVEQNNISKKNIIETQLNILTSLQYHKRQDIDFNIRDIFNKHTSILFDVNFNKHNFFSAIKGLFTNEVILFDENNDLRNIFADYYLLWGNSNRVNQILNYHAQTSHPLIYVEDGFIRSKNTITNKYKQEDSISYSYTFDDLGFHFDGSRKNRLIRQIESNYVVTEMNINRSKTLIDMIVQHNISKYNHQPSITTIDFTSIKHKVLIIDQSPLDYSLVKSFVGVNVMQDMINNALLENPTSAIIFKIHPDNTYNHKNKNLLNFLNTHPLLNKRLFFFNQEANIISVLKLVNKVYVCSSLSGFEALLCGKEVITFGTPFYAGWGLTDDRNAMILASRYKDNKPKKYRNIQELFYLVYIWYTFYISPTTAQECEIEEIINYFVQYYEEQGKY